MFDVEAARARMRYTGLIVAVLGLWGLFASCAGLAFVGSFAAEEPLTGWTNAETRSLATSWTIMATIAAAVLVVPALVLRRRAAGRGRSPGRQGTHARRPE
ncbi:hypothetical protein [Dactylosporangium matsuzakiense]|uniref:Uncharacterized protein n=1 Tax=Dactylosporangium matsuzakiense TaxID=53360 RepID=A0A9W6KT02_9ACTN|nr:hypothetical protein [Dactylosporangium matsuzakiense]GLL07532.1 hypothetical protein GCM10017581_092860 [Dactylosporangium matsuzakiense]